jgi:hypothetical protein
LLRANISSLSGIGYIGLNKNQLKAFREKSGFNRKALNANEITNRKTVLNFVGPNSWCQDTTGLKERIQLKNSQFFV